MVTGKRIGSLIFVVSLFLFSACSSPADIESRQSAESEYTDDNKLHNEILSIYSLDDTLITTIELYDGVFQTESGFLYGRVKDDAKESKTIMEYYYFDLMTSKSTKVGSINDWAYTAYYDVICKDNHFYMVVTTGDIWENKVENYLIDFDLQNYSMRNIKLAEGKSPYSSMALLDDCVYISIPGTGQTDIFKYKLNYGSAELIKEVYFDKATNTGNAIRQITAENGFIYSLRLSRNTVSDFKLYIDKRDKGFEIVESVDVSETFANTTLPDEDVKNELRQLVSRLFVRNGFVYYENFGISRTLTKCSENDLSGTFRKRIDCGYVFFAVSNAFSGDILYFYDAYQNQIYIVDTMKDEIKTKQIPFSDKRYGISYLTVNNKGDMLAFAFYHDPDTGETLPEKIYYVPAE